MFISEHLEIVPTPVGVNRLNLRIRAALVNCPHARGGEPSSPGVLCPPGTLSPRPWG